MYSIPYNIYEAAATNNNAKVGEQKTAFKQTMQKQLNDAKKASKQNEQKAKQEANKQAQEAQKMANMRKQQNNTPANNISNNQTKPVNASAMFELVEFTQDGQTNKSNNNNIIKKMANRKNAKKTVNSDGFKSVIGKAIDDCDNVVKFDDMDKHHESSMFESVEFI